MNDKNQQKVLRADLMPQQTFTDIINDACAKMGQGKLADRIGMDPGAFSRFKNGEGNISMKDLETLLSEVNAKVVAKDEIDRLYMAYFTINDMCKKMMGW